MVDGVGERLVDAAKVVNAPETLPEGAAPGKALSPQALRALEEAALRRAQAPQMELPPEINGRNGAEATRYGDWERKGLAVDF